jgi:four helix bundle protein
MDKPHKKLDVWKQSIALVTVLYELTKSFPKDEWYGLVNQIRRAAVSIPANIAEGAARQTKKEFIQFLCIARGSISEIDTYLEIAQNLGYLDNSVVKDIDRKMIGVDKMLNGLIKALKN